MCGAVFTWLVQPKMSVGCAYALAFGGWESQGASPGLGV